MLHYPPQHVSSSTLLILRRINCITTSSFIVTLCKQQYSMLVESILYGLQYAGGEHTVRLLVVSVWLLSLTSWQPAILCKAVILYQKGHKIFTWIHAEILLRLCWDWLLFCHQLCTLSRLLDLCNLQQGENFFWKKYRLSYLFGL